MEDDTSQKNEPSWRMRFELCNVSDVNNKNRLLIYMSVAIAGTRSKGKSLFF